MSLTAELVDEERHEGLAGASDSIPLLPLGNVNERRTKTERDEWHGKTSLAATSTAKRKIWPEEDDEKSKTSSDTSFQEDQKPSCALKAEDPPLETSAGRRCS